MMTSQHSRRPCPLLPRISCRKPAVILREFGKDRGPEFYFAALECAQSRWEEGLPAQALLLLNRAFSADLRSSDEILKQWPLPYEAMAWMLVCHDPNDFIGNPRRHFQHLATRMVEPRSEMRSARAWACWWLTRELMPDCPPDMTQIEEENLIEPTRSEILSLLSRHGLSGEAELWSEVITRLAPERWREDHCK